MVTPALIIIDMSPHWYDCIICDCETSGEHGVSVYEDEILPDDYDGEWAGFTVCPRCYSMVRAWQVGHPRQKISTVEAKRMIKEIEGLGNGGRASVISEIDY
jgi:hypothetical protein